MTASALGIVIGAALLMAAVGLSYALGAFIAGMMLAASAYRHEVEADIDAVWWAFTTNEGLRAWMAPLVEIELAVRLRRQKSGAC